MQKPDVSRLVGWADLGVSEVVYAVPEKPAEEVQAYLGRLSDKLDTLDLLGVSAAAQ
jgi:hypothetical protein